MFHPGQAQGPVPPTPVSQNSSQPSAFKFSVHESIDRIKEEFSHLQNQNQTIKRELEKANNEKNEIHRHYIMYYEMSYGLNVEMHKQTEIAKRLNAICAQVIPFLSQEHQQQVAAAVERAKQVTTSELNAIIGVSIETYFWIYTYTAVTHSPPPPLCVLNPSWVYRVVCQCMLLNTGSPCMIYNNYVNSQLVLLHVHNMYDIVHVCIQEKTFIRHVYLLMVRCLGVAALKCTGGWIPSSCSFVSLFSMFSLSMCNQCVSIFPTSPVPQFNQQHFNVAVGAAGIPPPFLPQGGIPPPPQIMASYPAPIPIPSTVAAPSSSSTAPSSAHPRHSTGSSSKPDRTSDEPDERLSSPRGNVHKRKRPEGGDSDGEKSEGEGELVVDDPSPDGSTSSYDRQVKRERPSTPSSTKSDRTAVVPGGGTRHAPTPRPNSVGPSQSNGTSSHSPPPPPPSTVQTHPPAALVRQIQLPTTLHPGIRPCSTSLPGPFPPPFLPTPHFPGVDIALPFPPTSKIHVPAIPGEMKPQYIVILIVTFAPLFNTTFSV
jgi:hypothetical protein